MTDINYTYKDYTKLKELYNKAKRDNKDTLEFKAECHRVSHEYILPYVHYLLKYLEEKFK